MKHKLKEVKPIAELDEVVCVYSPKAGKTIEVSLYGNSRRYSPAKENIAMGPGTWW